MNYNFIKKNCFFLVVILIFFVAPSIYAIFCPQCGVENTNDSRFCKGCGFQIYEIVKYLSKQGDPVKKGFINRIINDKKVSLLEKELKDNNSYKINTEEPLFNEEVSKEPLIKEPVKTVNEMDKIQEIIKKREEIVQTPDEENNEDTQSNTIRNEKKKFFSTFPDDNFFEFEESETEEKVVSAEKKDETIDSETKQALAEGKEKELAEDETIDYTVSRDRKKPEVSEDKTLLEKTGAVEILLIYNGVDFDKYESNVRIYLNNYFIGNAILPKNDKKNLMEAVNSNLFGTRGSELFTKKYFVFKKTEIPAGVYQLKAFLKEKGFLFKKSWTKKWDNVAIKEGETNRIIYKWSDIRDFGK